MSYDDKLVFMVSLETMWGKVAELFRRFSSFKKYFGSIVDSFSTGGEEFFARPVWMEEKKKSELLKVNWACGRRGMS